MKMYRYTEEDRKIIKAAREKNKDKRAEKRLYALELRSSGKSAKEVSEIKARYEEAVGNSIGGSQIYYVLKRHGWRKVMPRSRHPKKASEEVIATSKKLKHESQS